MKRTVITEYDYRLAAAWCEQLTEKEEISPEETKLLIAFGKNALKGWARYFSAFGWGSGYSVKDGEWAIKLVIDTIPDGTELRHGHTRPSIRS